MPSRWCPSPGPGAAARRSTRRARRASPRWPPRCSRRAPGHCRRRPSPTRCATRRSACPSPPTATASRAASAPCCQRCPRRCASPRWPWRSRASMRRRWRGCAPAPWPPPAARWKRRAARPAAPSGPRPIPEHPAGRPSGGTAESVAALSVEAMRAALERQVRREGLLVAAAGAITRARPARRCCRCSSPDCPPARRPRCRRCRPSAASASACCRWTRRNPPWCSGREASPHPTRIGKRRRC